MIKSVLFCLGVVALCGESSNDASPTSVPHGPGDEPPLPHTPPLGAWEGGLLVYECVTVVVITLDFREVLF